MLLVSGLARFQSRIKLSSMTRSKSASQGGMHVCRNGQAINTTWGLYWFEIMISSENVMFRANKIRLGVNGANDDPRWWACCTQAQTIPASQAPFHILLNRVCKSSDSIRGDLLLW